MCKHFPRLKKYLSALITVFIVCACCFISSAASDGDTNVPPRLSDFSMKNSSSALPTEAADGIVTPTGTLKMTVLDEQTQYEQKVFTDLYSADSYTVYGAYKTGQTGYYNCTFDANQEKIATGSGIASKAMLNGSESMTDFEAHFTVNQPNLSASLYAGAAFRINASDFRTDKFGTQGYMLLLYSSGSENTLDVKVSLRKYGTSKYGNVNDYNEDPVTFQNLLSKHTDPITVTLKVEGDKAKVALSVANNNNRTETHEFSLRPGSKQTKAAYFDSGAFALVANGSHTFKELSLSGSAAVNYTEHEKALYNLTEQSTYTVYGNSTDTNYGITFSDGVISTAGQSKVKINGYTNIKDFHADFTVTRESGLLMGGIGFHLQDTAFEKAPFGTSGYLLYARRESGSLDAELWLRNYRTASEYKETQIGSFEGLLNASNSGVRLDVTVSGTNLTVTVYDSTDRTRFGTVENYSLLSEDANAGNYTGGSIAFVSNGAHKFSDISVSQTVSEPRYKTVENFEASADFIIPQEGLFDFGIMFNVQDTVNLSPGLSGFVLKAFRTKNTADNSVALQLIRYGTDASGNKNISLGGITGSTKKPEILADAKGAGEKIRLKLKVVRGIIYYSVICLTSEMESAVYTSQITTASTVSNITDTTAYSSGAVGCFSNAADVTLCAFAVTVFPDCKLDFGAYDGGSAKGIGTYSYGETVTVSAAPDYGYYFGGWYNGETLLCSDGDYTLTMYESLILTPKFIPHPLKYLCSDSENRTVMLRLDDIDGVTEIGCEVTVKSENKEEVFNLSTAYVNAAADGNKPWIADRNKIYYCDINNDGSADTADKVSLRKGLINGDSTLGFDTADLNGDGSADIRDLIRFEKALSYTAPEFTEDITEGFNYPFVIGNRLNQSGKQYICLKPYTVKDGQTQYSAARYFTYNGTVLESNSTSERHTPFGQIRIACVGDSITKGIGATGWKNGDFTYAYPEQLGRLLSDSCLVGNFGKGSSYVYYKSGRTENLWYPNTAEYTDSMNFDPDIVIIKLGTNDAKYVNSDDLSNEWAKQFTDIVSAYRNLDSKPDIYIMSSITMKLYDDKNIAAETANYIKREPNLTAYILPKQKSVAEELGCTFLDSYNDLYELFSSGDSFASDMIHPNDKGYAAIAEYVKQNISLDIFY